MIMELFFRNMSKNLIPKISVKNLRELSKSIGRAKFSLPFYFFGYTHAYCCIWGFLAQSVEQQTLNLAVLGSIPRGPTIQFRRNPVYRASQEGFSRTSVG